jgi:hypothetical protein
MKMSLQFIIPILWVFSSCGLFENDTPEFFTVTPVSAVEVALQISADSGDKISIVRDGTEIFSFRMSRKDTVVYDAGLAPNTSYIWKAINRSSRRDKNKERQATTLPTTSSDFIWQTFSFGEHSSSTLYGVSIIDENDIWAVGEIHMNDSTGQTDDDAFNAAHWNGEEWELIKLQFYTFCNQSSTGSYRATSVLAFSESDIWASSLSQVTRFDRVEQKVTECIPTSVNKLWGTNNTNVYAVGNNSIISHYDGETWQKIETGTELDIEDIYGNEQQGVVAVASKLFESSDNAILKINENSTADLLSNEGITGAIEGIWFDESGVSYIVGAGMYRKSNVVASENWRSFRHGISDNYMFGIDANGLNDIMVSGDTGELLHFNGAGWTSYKNGFRGYLYAVDIYGNLAVAVGFDGGKAIITMGTREND